MHSITKILVAVPPTLESPALERGRQLALKLDANLHLLLCDANADPSRVLDQLLVGLLRSGVHARGEVAPVDIDHASAAVMAVCRAQRCDLIIKQHKPGGRLSHLLMTPDDWQLLRQAPTPLFLIRSGRDWEGGTVLAGMDVEHQDAAHVTLQGSVMEHASFLCGLFRTSLHVVSAYSPALLPQADPTQTIDQAVASHCQDQCQWFMQEYELPRHRLHIGEGPARTLIPQVAREFEAVLTVLGTVGREGVAGMLVGNTAEAVLDHLEGDLLVITPMAASREQSEPAGHRAA
ncbi:universal stress protein [Pseudomonas sp. TCU-HL1]|uniref:universal stress protein n=1 Tax=Pseudomonas sp. TCU-HL1 TaxID=1856685 RepID=UPI00083E5992|nr:universal stress protein [Pseudomonas sp. TCU-HL1]AOE84304.1 hypothetical protein THL1_1756 [Pseudomonas sp. TCU-HL1]